MARRRRSVVAQLLSRVVRDLRDSLKELITYEVLFKLLVAAVLSPLSALVVSLLIGLTGSNSLSNEQIATFVFSPLGVLTVAVALMLGFAIALAEEAGLLVIAASHAMGAPQGALQAMRVAAGRAAELLKLTALQLGILALPALPLLAIAAAVYKGLLGEHDINFYLAQRPPEFLIALAIGGVLAAVGAAAFGVLHIRWLFALPACVLDGQPALEALRLSWRLTRGTLVRLAIILIGWLLATMLLGVLLAALLKFVGTALLALSGEGLAVVVPLLAVLAAAHLLSGAIVSFCSITTHSFIVSRLYQTACLFGGASFASGLAREEEQAPPIWLTNKRLVFTAAIGLFVLLSLCAYAILEQTAVTEQVAVTAHRGSSLRAPENTMAAFRLAIEEGADYIELDVQETADGVIVVMHDKDFMRVSGVKKNIWETQSHELAQLDVGSWFEPQFGDQRVPTLKEVIDAVRGKAKLNIELKYNGHDERLAERVIDVIRQEDFTKQCVISSLNQVGIQQVRQLAPEIVTGLIVSVSIGDLAKFDADFLSLNQSHVSQSLINSAHSRGKQIHVWTVNDEASANRLIDMGADNLLTDDPKMLVALLRERSQLGTGERLLLAFRRWAEW